MKTKKFKKKQFTPVDLAKEVDDLITDSDRIKTESEISDWLVRLYTVAGKLTITQKACRNQSFTGEIAVAAKYLVDEYVPNMLLLHKLAENALAKMAEVQNES